MRRLRPRRLTRQRAPPARPGCPSSSPPTLNSAIQRNLTQSHLGPLIRQESLNGLNRQVKRILVALKISLFVVPGLPVNRGRRAPVPRCPDESTQTKYRRWESNPHGRFRPEDFKSSASAIPPRRLLRRRIDRQEMPQKERAGPAGPVRDRRWSDSQSIGPERWNSKPRPAQTSPRRTFTGVRALRRPRPRDPARRRCPCSDRAARPAFPDTCRPAVGRGKPPDSCLGGWRSRIPGCPTRRRGAA